MPSASSTISATARLEARISADLHAMLKRAAETQGRTMTDFVVAAVQDPALRAIEQDEVICLSMADQECFAQALLAPPAPTQALKRDDAAGSCPQGGATRRACPSAALVGRVAWSPKR